MKQIRAFALAAVLSGMAALCVSPSPASAQDATIEMQIGKVGFVVGVSRGDGRVMFRGQEADVEIGGLRVGLTIGASYATMRGDVYNLERLEDIEGHYVAAQASVVAVRGGGQNLALVNEHGVRLLLVGEQQGLEASLDSGGMVIKLR